MRDPLSGQRQHHYYQAGIRTPADRDNAHADEVAWLPKLSHCCFVHVPADTCPIFTVPIRKGDGCPLMHHANQSILDVAAIALR